MNTEHWIRAVSALRSARQVVVFSGAGISAESGIPTFRDTDGFWQRFPPEQFATWDGLLSTAHSDPHAAAEFVLNVLDPVARAGGNAAHRAVVELEQRFATTVVTQNVDGLHRQAGSRRVLEIHGTLLEVVDTGTRSVDWRFERPDLVRMCESLRRFVSRQQSLEQFVREFRQLFPLDWLGRHRPNLVLFGDELAEPAWSQAFDAVIKCEVLISVGTSGVVYPAASLPDLAELAGATVISINPDPSPNCWLAGRAEDVLPRLVREVLNKSA